MSSEVPRRALLLVLDEPPTEWVVLLERIGWSSLVATSFEQARFLQQHQPGYLLVVVTGRSEWRDGLRWLMPNQSSAVFATDAEDAAALALRQGIVWLPREVSRNQPSVLAAALAAADRRGEEWRSREALETELAECRQHIDRLLALLWEATPICGSSYLSQRHILERLDEEVARNRRQGTPLALALGEVLPSGGETMNEAVASRLTSWALSRIGDTKRRCDLAGRYGPNGLLLLLPGSGPQEARHACRRFLALLTHPPHDGLPGVHARFGLASLPEDNPSVASLLSRAEERLGQGLADLGLAEDENDS